MIVRLEDIPPEGLDVQFETSAGAGEGAAPLEGTLDSSLRLERFSTGVLVRGEVRGRLRLQCSRCLRAMVQDLREEIRLELRPAGEMDGTHEMELGQDDLDVEHFRGDALDLGHLVLEQASLCTPMKPLCSDGCVGLCPVCGRDRSGGEDCGCAERRDDPRWDALRALRDRMSRE